MRKKAIIAVCLVVAAAAVLGGKYLHDTAKYKKIIADIDIKTPSISQIQDGVYNGTFDAVLVAADVDVTVENHRISDIKINSHKNERGPSAEVITNDVIAAQSLEVDTVSGATNSSKVILKAIENALENASE